MDILVFTSTSRYASEEDLRDAYTFGTFIVPRKEVEYLITQYPNVNLSNKLNGLSKWVKKHPDVGKLDQSQMVERRFKIENDETETKPGFAVPCCAGWTCDDRLGMQG